MECSLCARHCAKYFTHISPWNSCGSHRVGLIIITSILQVEKTGEQRISTKLNNSSGVMQLVSMKPGLGHGTSFPSEFHLNTSLHVSGQLNSATLKKNCPNRLCGVREETQKKITFFFSFFYILTSRGHPPAFLSGLLSVQLGYLMNDVNVSQQQLHG